MNAEPAAHRGGCRCGAARFVAEGKVTFAAACHCEDCRKASGAPMLAFVGFAAASVRYEVGVPSVYEKGPVSRRFCGHCGTPLSYEDRRVPENVYFVLGAMDEPDRYPPTHHAYWSEKLAFLSLADDLPRFEKTSVPRP